MAADQRKRRPSSTMAPFGCGIQEQYRAKKREFRPLQFEVNYSSHVSLKWDENEKMVVAKEEQIGISSRQLAAFSPVSNSKLADVVAVPKEVFELDDLAEVLTYEGWQSLLTDKDRTFLSQFLPEGFESDEIVQALLGCENFHFGNPFRKWSSSLCQGNFHPDAVVRYEKSFKASKKAYYSELQQYHENMIKNLHKLKERCGNAKDPESEIMKLMSRSKGHAENFPLPDSNGFSSQKIEAKYESASSLADDKSYYSDNQKLSVIRDAEIQRRIRNQELIKDKHDKLSSSPNSLKGLPRPKKVEKSQKASMTANDGSKYMSYVKISKKQHEELVLSMGQSGPVIQPKNLNRLLGNLDSYNVKPYVMFEEEEQKRIHDHWINVVNKDLPATLEKWRRVQLERLQIMSYLCQEIEDKVPLLTQTRSEKLVKTSGNEIANAQNIDGDWQVTFKNYPGNKFGIQGSISDSDKPTQSPSSIETSKQSLTLNIDLESDRPSLPNHLDVNDKIDPSSTINQSLQNSLSNINKEFDPSSKGNQSIPDSPLNVKDELGVSSTEKNSSSGKSQELDPMDLNSEKIQVSSETRDTSSASEEHAGPTFVVSLGISHTKTHSPINNMLSSAGLAESSISLPESTMCSTPFASSSELTAGLPRLVTEQQPIDLDVFSVVNKSSSTTNQEFDPMDLNSENNQVSSETHETCSPSEEHVGQTSAVSLGISHTKTQSSVNMWSLVGLPESSMGSTPFASSTELNAGLRRLVTEDPPMNLDVFSMENKSSSTKNQEFDPMRLPESYGLSHPNTPFASSSELTVGLPRLVPEQPAHLINLGHNLPGGHTKDLLNRHTNHLPFVDSLANRERNESLLPSLILRDNFHQEQKKTGPVFHPGNVLLEPNQFPSHTRGELFVNQTIQDSVYSDNSRYSFQGPEHFSTLNTRNWANARGSTQMQPQLSSGGQLPHNWFVNDIRATHSQGSWSTPEVPVFSTSSLGSGSGDQSLYSVLSQCNSLQPRTHYNPVGSTEPVMIHSTSYGQDMVMANRGIPVASNPIRPTSPFDYLSGGEATGPTLKNPMGWMSLGNPHSALQDPSGKPFGKSWNP